MQNHWDGFRPGKWTREINVQDFLRKNFTPYTGDEAFLSGPTERTTRLWTSVTALMQEEQEHGVLDAETELVSSITSHPPGYIDKEIEQIVGLQTDRPLKRGIMPFGGILMVKKALDAYGYTLDAATEQIFEHRKTHNDGVFDTYRDAISQTLRNYYRITRLLRTGPNHRRLPASGFVWNRQANRGQTKPVGLTGA